MTNSALEIGQKFSNSNATLTVKAVKNQNKIANDFKVKVHKLHKKAYKNTWTYDNKVNKAYTVILTVRFKPKGGTHKRHIDVNAYNEYQACNKACKLIDIRKEDEIVAAEAVAKHTI